MRSAPAYILAMTALLALPTAPHASGPDPAYLGYWLTEKKGVLIELYPCQDEVCGRVAWLEKPFRRSGELRLDKHNPDPELRKRPWCGSEVIEGLKVNGNGVLESGQFYYLGDGATYSLELKPGDDGTVKARAYLGIKLLGKSETWTRPGPSIAPGCPEKN
jgi:uncharacterized protein (DUF2147 family)